MDLFKKSVIVFIFLCTQQMSAAVTIAEKNRAMLLQGYLGRLSLRSQQQPLSALEQKSVESVLTQLKKVEERDPELHLVENVQPFIKAMKYAAPVKKSTATKTETKLEKEPEKKEGVEATTQVQQLSSQQETDAIQRAAVLKYIDALQYDKNFVAGFWWPSIRNNWLDGFIKICKQNSVSVETIETTFVSPEFKKKIMEIAQKHKFNGEEVYKRSIERLKEKIAKEKESPQQQQGVSVEKPEELTSEQVAIKGALGQIAQYIQKLTQEDLAIYKVGDLDVQRFRDAALIPIMFIYNDNGMRLDALAVQQLLHAKVTTYGLAPTFAEMIVSRSVDRLEQIQEVVNYINALTDNDFHSNLRGIQNPYDSWLKGLIEQCKNQNITIGSDLVFEILSKKISKIAHEKKFNDEHAKQLVDKSIKQLQKLMQKAGVQQSSAEKPKEEQGAQVGVQQGGMQQGQQQQVIPPKEQTALPQEVVDYINALTAKNFSPAIFGMSSSLKNNWLEGLAAICKKNSISSDSELISVLLNAKVTKIAAEKKLNVEHTTQKAIEKLKQLMKKLETQQQQVVPPKKEENVSVQQQEQQQQQQAVVEPPKEKEEQQVVPPKEQVEPPKEKEVVPPKKEENVSVQQQQGQQQQQVVEPPKEPEKKEEEPPVQQGGQEVGIQQQEEKSEQLTLSQKREIVRKYIDTLEKKDILPDTGAFGEPVRVDPKWIEGLVTLCKDNDLEIDYVNVYERLETQIAIVASTMLSKRKIELLFERTKKSIEKL